METTEQQNYPDFISSDLEKLEKLVLDFLDSSCFEKKMCELSVTTFGIIDLLAKTAQAFSV